VPDLPARAAQLGALAFLLRPTYIAAEVVTAAATTGGYSFVSDSVSRLGEVGCSAAYCSPRHEVMNGSFMGYGVLLAGGALERLALFRSARTQAGRRRSGRHAERATGCSLRMTSQTPTCGRLAG
jgi:hypothetical protein